MLIRDLMVASMAKTVPDRPSTRGLLIWTPVQNKQLKLVLNTVIGFRGDPEPEGSCEFTASEFDISRVHACEDPANDNGHARSCQCQID